MLLYFYRFDPESMTITEESTQVIVTEKMYRAGGDTRFPFLHKQKMMKDELHEVSLKCEGFVYVTDRAEMDAAKDAFREYFCKKYKEAVDNAVKWEKWLNGVSGEEHDEQ